MTGAITVLLVVLAGLALFGVGVFAGYLRGMPTFLRCRVCTARLRGVCPHCKREQPL